MFWGNDVKWRLELEEITRLGITTLSIRLIMCESPASRSILTKSKFSILDKNRVEVNIRECEHQFSHSQKSHEISKFIEVDALFSSEDSLLPECTLTIYCEIDTREGIVPVEIPPSEIANNLVYLFESRDFSDVTLNVGEKEFKAHKALLAARSPIFRRMFTNNMKESNLNTVEITDLGSDVVDSMLRYVYTDGHSFEEISNGDQKDPYERRNIAIGLLRAADKYQMDRLKAICEHELYNQISKDNVVEILISAEIYNAARLKYLAIEFIGTNDTKMIDWSHIPTECAELAIHIMGDVVSHVHGPKSTRRRFIQFSRNCEY